MLPFYLYRPTLFLSTSHAGLRYCCTTIKLSALHCSLGTFGFLTLNILVKFKCQYLLTYLGPALCNFFIHFPIIRKDEAVHFKTGSQTDRGK